MKRIVLLGSTGSIGTQVLEVIRKHPDEFKVIGISAHTKSAQLQRQAAEFKPKYIVQTGISENPQQALAALASSPEADLIANAIVGYAGVFPTYAACRAGKAVALANKESLVMAGQLLMETAAQTGACIIPIDSEPSAVWQMIGGKPQRETIEKIILTASGGPFWQWKRAQLQNVSSRQALKHPTWKMGKKVSIDSATLMNKAFEIIETRWLFDIPAEKIDVTIHRQSTVHALVQRSDGTTSAVLSVPDMRIPITQALFYGQKTRSVFSSLNFENLSLTFEKPDYSIFEGPKLAYEVLAEGGIMPAAFCLADEIAVGKFLAGEIAFLEIYDFIKSALQRVKNTPLSIEALHELPHLL